MSEVCKKLGIVALGFHALRRKSVAIVCGARPRRGSSATAARRRTAAREAQACTRGTGRHPESPKARGDVGKVAGSFAPAMFAGQVCRL